MPVGHRLSEQTCHAHAARKEQRAQRRADDPADKAGRRDAARRLLPRLVAQDDGQDAQDQTDPASVKCSYHTDDGDDPQHQ